MINKLKDESQLLDIKFRQMVIQEIINTENVERKLEHLKRTEIYRDQTKKYVMERFKRQKLKEETLIQMENRATNISICKKIINKLARVYVGGVQRIAPTEAEQQKIDDLTRILDLNQHLKKADRYRELHKNALLMVLPTKEWDKPTYTLKPRVFAPWQYDVIEDYNDNETARVVVLTDFIERNAYFDSVGKHDQGDGREQIIADSDEDKGEQERTFIWWSSKYHFTTDDEGNVIAEQSPEGGLNPIGMIPGAFIAEDQDGNFWAEGGDDLINGSVLLNVVLTDMHSIMYQQGYGQLVVSGRDIPKELNVGPHTAIILEQQNKDDPAPSAQFISASPPVGDWMQAAEQCVALLLSTNNLSPSNVSGKLSANDFPSGVAMLIEQSEAMGELDDVKSTFYKVERTTWEVIKRWIDVYLQNKLLAEDLKAVGSLPSSDIAVKFVDIRPAVSEKEKLENLKARKDLALNTEIELLMLDNPDLTIEEAEKKLLQLKLEKLERMATFTQQQEDNQDGQSQSEEESSSEEEEVEGEDADLQVRSVQEDES